MRPNDVDAGRCSQCSPTNGHQEVDEIVVRSRRDVDEVVVRSHRDVDEVVVRSRRDVNEVIVQGASSHVKTLSKNLIVRYPLQDLQRAEVPKACSR